MGVAPPVGPLRVAGFLKHTMPFSDISRIPRRRVVSEVVVRWSTDPELQRLFTEELAERASRLIEGAQAMADGEVNADVAGAMLREGHTIKGTGRVMGFEAISLAGQLSEKVWRAVQHGDIEPSAALAGALRQVAEALPAAVEAAPDGTPALSEAVALLRASLGSEAGEDVPQAGEPAVPERSDLEHGRSAIPAPRPADETPASPPERPAVDEVEEPLAPDSPPEDPVEVTSADPSSAEDGEDGEDGFVTDGRGEKRGPETTPQGVGGDPDAALEDRRGQSTYTYDLGGLLGALDVWATEQTALVNAGRLYRLINHVAALRIDAEALSTELKQIADTAGPAGGVVAERVSAADDAAGAMMRTASHLEGEALRLASVPLRDVTNTLPQLVRYLSKKTGKQVRLEIVGDDMLVDRQVLEHLSDVIRHLIVNAVEHGIEEPSTRDASGKPEVGLVSLRAAVKEHQLEIIVEDDGAGVDWKEVHRAALRHGFVQKGQRLGEEALRGLLVSSGFSTVDDPNELAGDGAGLAKVEEAVQELYGAFTLDTDVGKGTVVSINVPTYRALQRALLVTSGGQTWGIPEAAVVDVLPMGEVSINHDETGMIVEWHDERIPMASFADAVGLGTAGSPSQIVVISSPVGHVALSVEEVVGSREVAAKELGPLLAGPQTVTGAALLGGGEVVLLVDAGRLAHRRQELVAEFDGSVPRVLIVDDSRGVQQVVAGALASSGFGTVVAGSVAEALGALSEGEVDAIVVDFSMPRADGVALVHMVRQRYGDLPIVMLSGVASPDDQARAEEAGVDAFFDKSDFREGALAETLRRLVPKPLDDSAGNGEPAPDATDD